MLAKVGFLLNIIPREEQNSSHSKEKFKKKSSFSHFDLSCKVFKKGTKKKKKERESIIMP